MTSQKVPGWGAVRPTQVRASPKGEQEFLICPDGHDAPFWAGLHEINRHKGRIIYQEDSSEGCL
jgi:hypothetical protein